MHRRSSLYEEWTALPQALSFVRAGETPFAGTTPNSATACGPCSARNGEVVGFTGAQSWPQTAYGPVGEIEIGRRLGRAAWGRGYATAAARLTLERLRAAGVKRVVAAIDSRNERSIAVARRLGMERAETFTTEQSGQAVQCFRLALNA